MSEHPSAPVRILLIQTQDDADVVENGLRRAGVEFESQREVTRDDVARAMSEFRPEVVIAEERTADVDAVEVLELARVCDAIPGVIVVGVRESADRLLEAGALQVVSRRSLGSLDVLTMAAASRTRAVEAMRQRDERFLQIADALPALVAYVDRDMRYVFVNRAFEEWFGRPRSEFLGRPVPDALGMEAYDPMRAHLEAAQAGCQVKFETRLAGRDGNEHVLTGLHVPHWDANGDVAGFVAVLSNGNGHETHDRPMPETMPVRISRSAPLGRWERDPESNKMRWSEEVYRILGVTAEQAPATWDAFFQRVHPADRRRVQAVMDDVLREGGPCNIDHRIVRPDGIVRLVNEQAEKAYDSGRAAVLLGNVVDITERRRGEEETRRLKAELERRVAERTSALEDANAQLNAFAYSVSHDLRAPLRAMQGFSQALLEDHLQELPGPAREYAKRIAEASQRMDALINDLLDYSRLARADVDVQPVALESVVDALLRDLEPELRRRQGAVAVERPLPSVYGHRLILAQVMANLLSNAVKFVAPGVEPRVIVRGEESGRRARIWVEDNGIGIAPEHHSRIFRVFERLHATDAYPGTGVGLAIVRKGVQRMGGRVGVESAPGAGSRFWFELARA